MRSFIFMFLISCAGAQLNAQTGEVWGVVQDRATHQPLENANVSVLQTEFGAASDSLGWFKVTGIPPGAYSIRVTRVGYMPVVRTDIIVKRGQRTRCDVDISETSLTLSEISVSGEYFSRPPEIATSFHKLSFEEVRRAPGAFEDVSRVVLSLPGVAFSADMRNDLIVRGGSPAENLMFLDNIEVPNINHLGTQGASGGPIGIINTEFISDVSFLTGGFPAQYGDKLSSVMSISLREGRRDHLGIKANVSAAGAGLMAEGPAGTSSSWYLAARRSYLDFLIKTFTFSGITIVPTFIDIQGKFVYEPDERNKLSFLGFAANDYISFSTVNRENTGANPDISGMDNVKAVQSSYVAGATWRRLWSNEGFSLLTASVNSNTYFTDVKDSLDGKTYFNDAVETEYNLKAEASWQVSKLTQLLFGGGTKIADIIQTMYIKPDTSRWFDILRGTGIFPELEYTKSRHMTKAWGYAQVVQKFLSSFIFTGGIRVDYFGFLEHPYGISPRMALRWQMDQRHSLSFSAGNYTQSPAYLWLLTDERNKSLLPMEADHLVGGYEFLPADDFRLTVDLFYKKYVNYPVMVRIPSYIMANGGTEPGAFIAGELSSSGTGFARGIEFFLQKKMTSTYYVTASYSYSILRFTALDRIERPGKHDYQHVASVVGGFKVLPSVEVSAKWQFAGGAPYTPINEGLSSLFGREILDLNMINRMRYPAYHRLDLRVDYNFFLGGVNIITYLDLQNVYDRKNIYYYIWDTKQKRVLTVNQWSLLPIAGLNAEF